jgi:conjugal transfer ATP-binding protein TraC
MRINDKIERLGSKLFKASGEGDKTLSPDFGESKNTQKRSAFLKGLFDIHQLTSLLNYATYDEETDLFYNTDSVGFVLETESLVGASQDIQTQVQNFFNTVMPTESAMQIILYADPYLKGRTQHYQQSRAQASPILKKMVEKRSDFFESLVYDSPYSPFSTRNFRILWVFTCAPDLRASEILTIREQLNATLYTIGLNPWCWKATDLLKTVDSIIHCAKGDTAQLDKKWNPYQNLSDQLASVAFQTEITEEELTSNAKMKIRTFTVVEQPDEWSLGLMADLIGSELNDRQQIGCPFLMHYGVLIPKQDGVKAKIFSKESMVSKQANSPLSKILPKLKRESAELAYVLSRLNKGDRVVQTNMSVILMAPKNEINSISNDVKNLFITYQWKLEENTRFHLPVLLQCLPMSWSHDMVNALEFHKLLKTTLTSEVANNLPCQGEWRGSYQPCLLMAGRKGQIFTWSPFENDTNYNTIVVGTSGSGKSVAMQELMMSLLGMGARVIVFDLGRSFEKSCHLVDGQHIRFEKHSDMCINPFSFVEEGLEEADANERRDQLEAISMTMEQMAARREGILDIQGNFLQKAVMETFEVYGRKTTVTHVVERLFQHDDARAKDVGTLLYNYTKDGAYGKWFEGQANVNLKSDLVVIELEDLKEKPSLQNVVLQSFLASMTQQLYLSDRKRKTVFIVDEAAQLLENKFFSKSAQDMARRVRKYEASLVVGTQSFADFYANEYSINILENAAWVLMLNQVPEAIQQLSNSKKLALTPHKEAKMKSVKTVSGKYAEILISSSKGYTVGRLLLDPFSLMLYSTKADEFAAVNDLRTQGLSVEEAVQTLVDLKQNPQRNDTKGAVSMHFRKAS